MSIKRFLPCPRSPFGWVRLLLSDDEWLGGLYGCIGKGREGDRLWWRCDESVTLVECR